MSRNSEFAANLSLAASRNASRPQSPRIVRNASRNAARVPTFGNVSRLAARALGACVAVVAFAGLVL